MSKSIRRVIVCAGVALVASCTRPNPNRCCSDEADCNANGIPTGSTCQEGLVCRGHQCISEPCSSTAECDPAAPYCVDGLCGEACSSDAQCPGFGQPDVSYCVGGACVACRDNADCTAPTSVCEGGTCRGCSAHSECAGDLCDLDSGACIAESSTMYVAPAGSTTSDCTRSDPCVLDRIPAVVTAARNFVKLLPGTHTVSPTFKINVIADVAFFGPATLGSFTVDASGAVRLRDLRVEGSVTCNEGDPAKPKPTLDIDKVDTADDVYIAGYRCNMKLKHAHFHRTTFASTLLLSGNSSTTGCDAVIDSCEFAGGSRAMSLAGASSIHVTNTIFRDIPTIYGAIGFGADIGSSEISFSTFYNTHLDCSDGSGSTAVKLNLRNNLFLNLQGTDTITGPQCAVYYNLIKPQATTPSGDKNILNMDPLFVNEAAKDFHLTSGSPARDAADPAATEALDYDGTARPQGPHHDMGAFELTP